MFNAHFQSLLREPAPDMETFAKALHQRLHYMSRLGIFKSVDVLLDAPPADVSVADEYVPVDVRIAIQEKPRFFLKSGSEFSKNEASLVGYARLNLDLISRRLLALSETFLAMRKCWSFPTAEEHAQMQR